MNKIKLKMGKHELEIEFDSGVGLEVSEGKISVKSKVAPYSYPAPLQIIPIGVPQSPRYEPYTVDWGTTGTTPALT